MIDDISFPEPSAPRIVSLAQRDAELRQQARAGERPPTPTAAAKPAPATAAPAPRFDFLTLSQLKPTLSGNWIIKGLLPSSGLGIVYGEPGCGKSFATAHALMHVAAGLPYAGRRTTQGAVVYVAAEGQRGFANRLIAAKDQLAVSSDCQFALITVAPNLGTGDQDANALVDRIASRCAELGWRPAVVAIDTVTRALPGQDLNSSQSMSAFAQNCGLISNRLGALVLGIHHVGKDASRGMLGSTVLHGASDCELEVTQATDGTRTVSVRKNKDGEDNVSWTFRLSQVVLGLDADGDAVTTCTVTDVTPAAPGSARTEKHGQRDKAPAALRMWLACLINALGTDAAKMVRPYPPNGPTVRAVDRETVRAEFYAGRAEDKPDAKRQAFDRGLKSALDRKAVIAKEIDGRNFLWLP